VRSVPSLTQWTGRNGRNEPTNWKRRVMRCCARRRRRLHAHHDIISLRPDQPSATAAAAVCPSSDQPGAVMNTAASLETYHPSRKFPQR
jgi:hypothetical protein